MPITGLSQYLTQHPVLTLLLICHFLSDFHLQSQTVADRKNTENKYLLIHLLGVAFPLVIVTLFLPSLWKISLLIFLTHSVIDFGKSNVANWLRLNPMATFLLDQILHLVIIILLTRHQVGSGLITSQFAGQVLNMILFLVLITKPTNIVFKIFFQKYQPHDNQKMDTIPGAGATIGLLERIVMSICIIFNQFASIGLVFTAKSIARYNKISESPAFAEYYLIGSLFSILSVLLAAWICIF
ncbi:DUF3307 domain-containing protein [Streptococcus lutetiensis]|uniref:DUF3307 domain-containing protein n=1 Tax=Streptococcus lutetiensis TaxID=150055 RepID=UPI00117E807F|nr:DUF3307 domain-containing protein [Streptococcus lutetiensis]MBT0891591.1 DUF3307 domain-containing protein [Streptococcus lutetiensis]MBT0902942.1 DUF3307 domain-containing protein [Streptococcus lutetiensis]MBT0943290.1 DUF3307 domain-containing protein [Streptococcus lutetiensis]MBT0948195.1 DUF3307 domain-containing protein [Streptococcus lutetiensis]